MFDCFSRERKNYCQESELISLEKGRRIAITVPAKQLDLVLHDQSETINNIRNKKLKKSAANQKRKVYCTSLKCTNKSCQKESDRSIYPLLKGGKNNERIRNKACLDHKLHFTVPENLCFMRIPFRLQMIVLLTTNCQFITFLMCVRAIEKQLIK